MSSSCYHCGEELGASKLNYDEHPFCCDGCITVYRLLKENDLTSFYQLEQNPGIKPEEGRIHKYKFLDVPSIRKKHILFEDDKYTHISLYLPQIHCSSCIYLLENLHKLVPEVISSQVDFTGKTATIVVNSNYDLSELALLLDKIGYAPNFGGKKETEEAFNKKLLIKLGIAGFAFGSIMLWTFPEYLGIAEDSPEFRTLPSLLSFLVSIPVLIYSANDYLVSAWKALKFKSINLDVPISLGIIALYAKSCFEIFSWNGPGYMDSFAGFIFFLLIGRWFQNKTYTSFRFDRDYKSYFPVAISRIVGEDEEIVEIENIQEKDQLLIRNEEIIPCDSIVLSDSIIVDYSFVTGESIPVRLKKGDLIYAGGKLLGTRAYIEANKTTDRSHLTQLWNDRSSKKSSDEKDTLSRNFLIAVLFIALVSAIFWTVVQPGIAVDIVVSVLIVACPCALALSKPFTLGSIMRRLGNDGLYLKSATIIESFRQADVFVFDKTGTLTNSANIVVETDKILDSGTINLIYSVVSHSNHPLSKALVKYCQSTAEDLEEIDILNFKEVKGAGLSAIVEGILVKIGSSSFNELNEENHGVSVTFNNQHIASFKAHPEFRESIWTTLQELSTFGPVYILSGDTEKDAEEIKTKAPFIANLFFQQSPQDKLNFVESLQKNGKKVMMIGDGLNDAGALETAEMGIAVSDNVFNFTPGSDAIVEGKYLYRLASYLRLAKSSSAILNTCYVFSIIYNLVGLSFAVTGNLSPLIAAILMPLSSITIVLISTVLSRLNH